MDKESGRIGEGEYMFFTGVDGHYVLVEWATSDPETHWIYRRLNEDFELFYMVHNSPSDPMEIIKRDSQMIDYTKTLVRGYQK